MSIIGFGGGCHWCTEAVFQSLKGVNNVRQGFIRSVAPADCFSEAVEVTFSENQVSVTSLISAHLLTHASLSNHSMRGKYRSAIYAYDDAQIREVEAILAELKGVTGADFITQVLLHKGFKPSDKRFHNYYENDPTKPFCTTYIDPKLAKLRQKYPMLMK